MTIASGVTYKPFGPLAGLTFGNSVVLGLTYDQDYELTGISAAKGATVIQNLTNAYDADGNIYSITDALTPARNQSFTFDNLNRLKTASGLYGSLTYTYDSVGNRLTVANGASTDTYTIASASKPFGPLAGLTFGNSVVLGLSLPKTPSGSHSSISVMQSVENRSRNDGAIWFNNA